MNSQSIMSFVFAGVFGGLVSDLATAQTPAEVKADKATFERVIHPFLMKHCAACHGEEEQEAKVRLDVISHDLVASKDADTWQDVLEALQHSEMPPDDEPQPTEEERNLVIKWIQGELTKSGKMDEFQQKMQKPHYGNYVDHDKLFSGEIKDLPYTPARLWRRSPDQFEKSKYALFGNMDERQRRKMEYDKIKPPFHRMSSESFDDYAALLYADSATFDTLHRNAAFVVDRTLKKAFLKMDYEAKGKTMEDWANEVAEYTKDLSRREKTAYMKRYAVSTPGIYNSIIFHEGKPERATLEAAINHHFERSIQRPPTAEELKKFTDFMSESIDETDNYWGLRNALIAVMVSPAYIYRSEIGLGKQTPDGRSMLSPVELAYAISFALTDQPPDEELISAVKNGRLSTKEDVSREVVRMLKDDSISKPRILRFFHEFFGYDRAPDIFKDEERTFVGYTGYRVARYYVWEADTLVRYILKKDKDVLKELLTTDKYFVSHSGNNESVRKEVEKHRKFYEYFKDHPWKTYRHKNPPKEVLEEAQAYVKSIGMSPKINGRSIFELMNLTASYFKDGKVPNDFRVWRGAWAKRNALFAYNLDNSWSRPVEQPFVLPKGKRAGILTHPAWLIAHSMNAETDPVRRGKWVRERLLAGTVPDVPITVDAVLPEEHHNTLRERFRVTKEPECWKCHVKMNPLGMTFEMYDDLGRWRDQEMLEHAKVGKNEEFPTKPVNAVGYLDGTGDPKLDGEVEDAVEMVNRLAQSRRVQQSFIRHAFRYWMGRNELLSDSKTLIEAEKAYIRGGGSFNALVHSLLTSDSFIYRKRQ